MSILAVLTTSCFLMRILKKQKKKNENIFYNRPETLGKLFDLINLTNAF